MKRNLFSQCIVRSSLQTLPTVRPCLANVTHTPLHRGTLSVAQSIPEACNATSNVHTKDGVVRCT